MLTNGSFQRIKDQWVRLYKSYVGEYVINLNFFISIDAHAPASLLKLWYRELYDPLIPDGLYDECVATDDPKEVALIIEKLPAINKLVRSKNN